MARGGKRTGKPGLAYPNRTDLNNPPQPGMATFKGQPYGVAGQQQAAQQAVPTGQPALQGSPAGPAGPGVPVPAGPAPGSFGAFDRPTERPDEPVTAGIPTGPGSSKSPMQPPVPSTVSDLLNVVGNSPGVSPEVKYLMDFVNRGRA